MYLYNEFEGEVRALKSGHPSSEGRHSFKPFCGEKARDDSGGGGFVLPRHVDTLFFIFFCFTFLACERGGSLCKRAFPRERSASLRAQPQVVPKPLCPNGNLFFLIWQPISIPLLDNRESAPLGATWLVFFRQLTMAEPKPPCDCPLEGAGDFGNTDAFLAAGKDCNSSSTVEAPVPSALGAFEEHDATRQTHPSVAHPASENCASDSAAASRAAGGDTAPRSLLDTTDNATAAEEGPRKLLEALKSSVSCLIVTDVQRDFCEGGALGGEGRLQMVHNINRLRCWRSPGTDHPLCGVPFEQLPTSLEAADIADELFDYVVVSQDWHPPNHLSFAKNHASSCDREACICGDEQEETGDATDEKAATSDTVQTRNNDRTDGTLDAMPETPTAEEVSPQVANQHEETNGNAQDGEVNEGDRSGDEDAQAPETVTGERAKKKGKYLPPLGPNRVRRRKTGVVLDLWPVHCVQNTPGAELHPNLLTRASDVPIHKATDREIDSYSCFGHGQHKTGLESLLREWKVEVVCVVGLCVDYCVKATALAAAEVPGVQTVCVLLDCSKAVAEEAIPTVRKELSGKGILVCTAKEMLRGQT
ncbi:Nicotinamidase [Toxoplasma gondii GT1]|uniref:nicotinamidase n=2 Tax=Toxoplasma gondii TaxID=5811 RepID=S7UW84_TOXGG|nr:Nicotinamidase [Toxoplasma gondii GT1]KAF4643070.1 Nicotinamidase [Toxoplasma gondii]